MWLLQLHVVNLNQNGLKLENQGISGVKLNTIQCLSACREKKEAGHQHLLTWMCGIRGGHHFDPKGPKNQFILFLPINLEKKEISSHFNILSYLNKEFTLCYHTWSK